MGEHLCRILFYFKLIEKKTIGKRYLRGKVWPEYYKSSTGGSDNPLPEDELSLAKEGSGDQ